MNSAAAGNYPDRRRWAAQGRVRRDSAIATAYPWNPYRGQPVDRGDFILASVLAARCCWVGELQNACS